MSIVTPLPAVSGVDYNTASWTTGTAVPPTPMPKPTGLSDGDGLFFLGYDQVAASTITTPSTFAAQYHCTATSTRGFYLFGKQIPSSAGETATTYSTTDSNSGRGLSAIFRIPGANMTTLLDAAPASDFYSAVAANTMALPGVTGTAGALHLLCVFANGTGAVTHTFAATGYTVLFTVNVNNAGSTSSMAVLYKILPTTGATGSITVTMTPSDAATNPASFGGFSITEAASPASASAAMSGAGTMGIALVSQVSASPTMSGAGTMGAAPRVTELQSGVTMAGVGTMGATPSDLVGRWLSLAIPYCAHRDGCWGTYGEETLAGYAFAAAWDPDLAMEVSCWKTTDGVWVLSHDQTTGRVFSGTSLDITTSTWASLSSKTTLVGGNPIARLDDLLNAQVTGNRVFMIDNKGQQTPSVLLDLLDTYGGNGRFIAKGYINSTTWADAASARGYRTWGYGFVADVTGPGSTIGATPNNYSTNQSHWTMLSMDASAATAAWTYTLTFGKVIITDELGTAALKATALSQGAKGIMTSNITLTTPQTALPSMNGAGTLTGAPRVSQSVSPSMTGAGTMSATGVTGTNIAMSGVGTLAGTPLVSHPASPSMSGVGSLGLSARVSTTASFAMSGVGTMGATGAAGGNVSVTMSGDGQMSTTTRSNIPTPAVMTGIGTLGVSTTGSQSASPSMNGAGTMSVVGVRQTFSSPSFAGAGTMGITLPGQQTASPTMLGAGSLGISASIIPGITGLQFYRRNSGGTWVVQGVYRKNSSGAWIQQVITKL